MSWKDEGLAQSDSSCRLVRESSQKDYAVPQNAESQPNVRRGIECLAALRVVEVQELYADDRRTIPSTHHLRF